MGLDLLDAPIRLTWDFSAREAGLEHGQLLAIADRVVEDGVFFVTLQGAPLSSPAITEVVQVLTGGCQLLVECCGNSDELVRLAQLPLRGVSLLLNVAGFVDVEHGVDSTGLLSALESLRQLGHEPLLSLTPLRNNLCNIPDLLVFCTDHQVAKFKLPNAHIGDSVHDYTPEDLPRWQDLELFRKNWQEFTQRGCSLPVMEIHDLFLWEIMTPDQQQNRSEYGGCQAGNSLGHVDRQGLVHPCAAWPQQLGRLPEQSLADIWAGAARLAMREHIARMPEGCHDCSDLGVCFGGCRGLAFHLNQSAGERDLMCSGPR